MERGKRIKAIDGETNLPEAMIQHIQFFLNYKEAARTSLLSKSWFNAWSTQPILHIDQRNFQNPEQLITDGFSESSKKIMRRYEESKLKIESFRLCMKNTGTGCYSLANELIARAMGVGARDLSFEFLSHGGLMLANEHEPWIHSSRIYRTVDFVLAHEVLGLGNLGRLSVSGCRIDLHGLSMLKFLSLYRVIIIGYSIWDILSNCPLIEELVLYECTCSSEVETYNVGTKVITSALAWTEFGNQNVVHQITQYRNLKCLFLKKVVIDELLFHDTSRRFPCLKDLTLNECFIGGVLRISSPSLEFLSIAPLTGVTAKFDVPSLRKFTFSGCCSPSGFYFPFLSFEAASREWESDISLTLFPNQNPVSSSLLVRLKDFLMKLSLSKISLSLCFEMSCYGTSFQDRFDHIGDGLGLPTPVVENLMLSMHDAPTTDCSSLLKGVFWSCRPKFETEDWLPELAAGKDANSEMLKLLCKNLIEEESRCMDDLEEVNVEGFDESLAEWQPLQWKALLDASKSPEKKRKIRFKLRWGLHPSSLS